MPRRLLAVLAVILAAHAPLRAQAADTPAVLELVPLSGGAIRLTAAEWAALPRDTVRVAETSSGGHPTPPGTYTGVPLRALLTRMGVPAGAAVRGEALRTYVLAEASDGYRVIFSLPELDPAFTDAVVLVADHRDGAVLDAHDGPLRILAPAEKRPTRWVRGLVRLSVHRVE
ncbi:molybdopterin-dependent oxidoreductase [Longimicrobium sp.]|uniref:molybdopterin-dependent oxidoreductase n=1 Tax=Longimicrobium sp. TaxID=2029185 RepID=UPI002E33D232|nr:molybdopterin-dependent oxidoreductase [Longimicrobium sp.]HEX6037070.1 molybdopterin-dependent oxidoreductase [Longimicrobium sp.]